MQSGKHGNIKTYWQTSEDGKETRILGDKSWINQNPISEKQFETDSNRKLSVSPKKTSDEKITIIWRFTRPKKEAFAFNVSPTMSIDALCKQLQMQHLERHPDFYDSPLVTEESRPKYMEQMVPDFMINGDYLQKHRSLKNCGIKDGMFIDVVFPQIGG